MKAKLTTKTQELIEKRGRLFNSAPLPNDIPHGRVGWCFDDCFVRAWQSMGKYQYVEGIASDPKTHKWVLHAWLTDGICAFDPTWCYWDEKTGRRYDMPLPSSYIGIVMPIDKVRQFMEQTTYQGVIANRHRAPELAKELIGG